MAHAKYLLTGFRTLSLSLLVFMACATVGAAQERGRITAVRLTPDLKQIMIRFEGEIGKHSAFVMANPCRLVLDFEATGLAKLPGKISVNRDPISEIRLGAVASRSRLVVDFGDQPVPAFKIEQGGDMVTVRLSPDSMSGKRANARPAPHTPRRSSSAGEPHAKESLAPSKSASPGTSQAKPLDSRMVVKTAGINENLVFVELADSQNRKKVYRLVVDLDREQMNVRRATVSDEAGNLKRFDLAAVGQNQQIAGDGPDPQGLSAGPRKQSPVPAQPAELKPAKFKWGTQSSTLAESPQPAAVKRPGLRMKGFTLQQRKPGSEG